ncbi:hemolysin family protein [Parenemella sanctibonifatiensis]|uniref:HlyC/CorC family transporter n=1 Tax=Parenemella sanctibonifatiensis TaxID=2016505 RepID=A0A255EL49_9ACTN|nr:hemolysin family protein [Parenemella sanctibonifatiensis]OYN92214.1 hypothetical protein CGZ91_01510 [Parenemella sanctibonifatiensis]
MSLWLNIALILVFVVIGGVFAAAEMALVSLRDSQVKQLSGKGKRGKAVARITADPNLFLSSVQVGVTLSGFLSASFGGATLAPYFTPYLIQLGVPEGPAGTITLVIITIVISYFSIVIGELTAKRLAMQRAEGFALVLGPLIDGISRVLRPVIWFLGVSTNVLVRLLGGDPNAAKEEVSDEELRAMVHGSQTLGEEERQIMDDVFAAGVRSLREVMVPRTEVDFLPGDLPARTAAAEVYNAPHSRYPVTRDSSDDVIGFVHVRDLFNPKVGQSTAMTVAELVRPVVSLPDSVKVLHALSTMRRESAHLAIVRDEYGGTAGIVTMEDLVEELVGDITDEYDTDATDHQTPLLDDEFTVEGLMTLEEWAERCGYLLPEGPYDTVAGWIMAQTGQLPAVGQRTESVLAPVDPEQGQPNRFGFEIIELDGRRADQVAVTRLGEVLPEGEE